jgi:glycosyltransferase involved in cell wall biosynthesis
VTVWADHDVEMSVGTAGRTHRMRILQISGYYPPHLGGLEVVAQGLARALLARGHDVTVVTSAVGTTRRDRRGGGQGVRWLRALEIGHTPLMPTLPFVLWSRPEAEIWHLHVSHVYTDIVTFLIAKAQRRPYIAHVHMDTAPTGRLGPLFLAYKRHVLPHVLRGARFVVTLSGEQRALIIERYRVAPGRSVVVPNGLEEGFSVATRLPRAGEPTSLLFVGRFAKQKNLPRLIEAISLVQRPVVLHLVGDGETRPDVERQVARLGLTNVVLHGEVPRDKIVAHYSAADIFVLPSNREGMPMALLEAMAAGLPVVASDVQGLREFVGDGGVLVEDPSAHGFACAISALVDDVEARRTLGIRAQQWASRFAWEKVVSAWEGLYAGSIGVVN